MCVEHNEVVGKQLPGDEQHGFGKRLAEAFPTTCVVVQTDGIVSCLKVNKTSGYL